MAKRKIPRDPEQEARWEEERRQMAARLAEREAIWREWQERRERRRHRLKRLTFGLLGR